ncbi:MAG: PRC-barrel domain containing protein [Solirubrobacterales bacterium]|nr:PRC-barrel domain containing protein [Solirubrobacterales bacterium]
MCDPGARRIGVVDQVLIEPPTHGIFEGVIIHTVPLAGGAEALAEEQGHRHGGEEAHTPEPSLERLARRVMDRLVRRG